MDGVLDGLAMVEAGDASYTWYLWLLAGGKMMAVRVLRVFKHKKNDSKRNKRMTGVDEDFLGGFCCKKRTWV